jgi:hypothetical protein
VYAVIPFTVVCCIFNGGLACCGSEGSKAMHSLEGWLMVCLALHTLSVHFLFRLEIKEFGDAIHERG